MKLLLSEGICSKRKKCELSEILSIWNGYKKGENIVRNNEIDQVIDKLCALSFLSKRQRRWINTMRRKTTLRTKLNRDSAEE